VRVSTVMGAKDSQAPAARTGIVGTHWVMVGEMLAAFPLRSGKRSSVVGDGKS